jgi:two-component system response regulator
MRPDTRDRDDKWILLVEDDGYAEALTKRAFRKCGLEQYLVVARDGVEALNQIFGRLADGPSPEGARQRARALPSLVLLDLKMPRIDGFEVLRRLRARPATRLVPVVILSSSLDRDDVATSYALGANSYIRKPIDFSEFLVTASQLGLYWLGLNEPCPRAEGGEP